MPDRRDSPASVSNICTDLYKTTYRKLLRLSTAEQFRLQTKPRRVFRPQAKKQLNLVFSGGVYVGENTSQPVSVRVVRCQRTASARTGLHPLRRQSPLDFVDGLTPDLAVGGDFLSDDVFPRGSDGSSALRSVLYHCGNLSAVSFDPDQGGTAMNWKAILPLPLVLCMVLSLAPVSDCGQTQEGDAGWPGSGGARGVKARLKSNKPAADFFKSRLPVFTPVSFAPACWPRPRRRADPAPAPASGRVPSGCIPPSAGSPGTSPGGSARRAPAP